MGQPGEPAAVLRPHAAVGAARTGDAVVHRRAARGRSRRVAGDHDERLGRSLPRAGRHRRDPALPGAERRASGADRHRPRRRGRDDRPMARVPRRVLRVPERRPPAPARRGHRQDVVGGPGRPVPHVCQGRRRRVRLRGMVPRGPRRPDVRHGRPDPPVLRRRPRGGRRRAGPRRRLRHGRGDGAGHLPDRLARAGPQRRGDRRTRRSVRWAPARAARRGADRRRLVARRALRRPPVLRRSHPPGAVGSPDLRAHVTGVRRMRRRRLDARRSRPDARDAHADRGGDPASAVRAPLPGGSDHAPPRRGRPPGVPRAPVPRGARARPRTARRGGYRRAALG